MIMIATDPTRKLVHAHMSGFLTPEDVADFASREQAAVVAMGCGSGEFLLLVDTSGCTIQSQEVVAAFSHIIMNVPLKARRIAIVRGSTLTRMQTQRITMLREDAATFATIGDAEEWLFEPPTVRHDARPRSDGAAL